MLNRFSQTGHAVIQPSRPPPPECDGIEDLRLGFESDDGLFGSDGEMELLCQGIKPWDEDAGAALAVLRGDDCFFDW